MYSPRDDVAGRRRSRNRAAGDLPRSQQRELVLHSPLEAASLVRPSRDERRRVLRRERSPHSTGRGFRNRDELGNLHRRCRRPRPGLEPLRRGGSRILDSEVPAPRGCGNPRAGGYLSRGRAHRSRGCARGAVSRCDLQGRRGDRCRQRLLRPASRGPGADSLALLTRRDSGSASRQGACGGDRHPSRGRRPRCRRHTGDRRCAVPDRPGLLRLHRRRRPGDEPALGE